MANCTLKNIKINKLTAVLVAVFCVLIVLSLVFSVNGVVANAASGDGLLYRGSNGDVFVKINANVELPNLVLEYSKLGTNVWQQINDGYGFKDSFKGSSDVFYAVKFDSLLAADTVFVDGETYVFRLKIKTVGVNGAPDVYEDMNSVSVTIPKVGEVPVVKTYTVLIVFSNDTTKTVVVPEQTALNTNAEFLEAVKYVVGSTVYVDYEKTSIYDTTKPISSDLVLYANSQNKTASFWVANAKWFAVGAVGLVFIVFIGVVVFRRYF